MAWQRPARWQVRLFSFLTMMGLAIGTGTTWAYYNWAGGSYSHNSCGYGGEVESTPRFLEAEARQHQAARTRSTPAATTGTLAPNPGIN